MIKKSLLFCFSIMNLLSTGSTYAVEYTTMREMPEYTYHTIRSFTSLDKSVPEDSNGKVRPEVAYC